MHPALIPASTPNHLPSSRLDPVTDRGEQIRRCLAIDKLGYLCTEYGIETIRWWVAEPQLAEQAATDEGLIALVEDFGADLVTRWVSYHAWIEGKE